MEFGPFRIDVTRRLLYRDGLVVDVAPKAFAVLLALVERRGETVSKQELMDAVWPNIAVEENNLARSISTLRKALGEKSGEHKYILTIPGSGYRFVADESSRPEHQPEARVRMPYRLGVLAVVCAGLCFWIAGRMRPVDSHNDVHFRRILTSPAHRSAALSPDGKSIAYTAGTPRRESLRLRQVESGEDTELLQAADRSLTGVTFAPDGHHLFLVTGRESDGTNALIRLSLSDPAESRPEVARGLDSPVTVSPDGSRIAFVRETGGESVLVSRRLSDGREDRLIAANLPTFLDYPAWSPDGQSIAYSEATPEGVFLREWAVETQQLLSRGPRWRYLRRFAWLPAGEGFVVSGMETGGSRFQLWEVSRASGAIRLLSDSLDSLHGVVLSRDGTRALTIAERSLEAVWIGTPEESRSWRQLAPPSENVIGVSWAADRNIVLERMTANGRSAQLISPDGTNRKELLPPGPYGDLHLCGGQRKLVYSALSGRSGLWAMDLTSGTATRLLNVSADTLSDCAASGSSVRFVSKDPRWWPGIWSVPIEGGQPRQLAQRGGSRYAISADGQFAAYLDYASLDHSQAASPQKQATQIVVETLDGSRAGKRFGVESKLARKAPIRWLPKKPVITYAAETDGVSEIWGQDLAGGPPNRITNFAGGTIRSFDWSPDGKQMVLSRGMQSFELLLLELRR